MADQENDVQASGFEPEAESAIQTPRGHPKSKIQNPEGFIPLTSIGSASRRVDLATIRERLAGTRGRQYWRSLEALSETEEFQEYLQREFPNQAPRDWAPLGRREFFRVMGATLALAGVGGCAYTPPQKIVPYVEQPEELLPGKALFYTTVFQRGGYAQGVLGTSQMGRPTKLEGNPQHPASLGATDPWTQGSLLQLYDPDRSQNVRQLGGTSSWDVFVSDMTAHLETVRRTAGSGLALLIGAVTSPTLISQLRQFLALYPQARLYVHEPVSRDSVHAGGRLAFGEDVHPVYHFDRADVVVSLDSNFLLEEPGSVRYARDFADRRRVYRQMAMNRLYAIESTPTITGAFADHRLGVRAGQVEALARAIAAGVGSPGAAGGAELPPGVPAEWIPAVVSDLKGHRGTSLVVAGMLQPPVVHALAHAINEALGNIGKTVTFTAPVEANFGARQGTLRDLATEMNAGRVQTLVVLGSNPVYTAPADVNISAALQKVPLRIHHGLYDDETGIQCQWHVPESHYLEAWSDARAYDGTASIVQPLITPLYDTRSAHELLAVLLGEGERYGYDIVREYWMGQDPRFAPPGGRAAGGRAAGAAGGAAASAAGGTAPGTAFQTTVAPGGALTQPSYPSASAPIAAAFEQAWYRWLTVGVIDIAGAPARTVRLKPNFAAATTAPAGPGGGMELIFRPDPTIWDGSFSNNGWLQELPKPLTTLTWDNAAMVSPRTAQAQRLGDGDMVELRYLGRTLPAAILVVPGHPDDAVTLTLGYGRTRAGRVGTGTGFNAYALRTSDAPWFGSGLEVHKTSGYYNLVKAQTHMRTEGRDLVHAGTLEEYRSDPAKPAFMETKEPKEPELPSLYPQMWPSDRLGVGGMHGPAPREFGEYKGKGYLDQPIPAWGMVIDLNTCIGCNACTIACQAENNIATVGKGEVDKHRQMHWIRIDNYYWGDLENPSAVFEPVPCMQCEKAPCEPVCPVFASAHSAEGLNDQTYNRCVGTRYCSNNCPYKVRRFNFLQYADQQTPVIQLMRNPNVTVRSRGVMEKCTYCVQRINEARIQAEKEDRPIREGDVVPACAQVCPTRAILFGNINDTAANNGAGSLVRQLKQQSINYTLLPGLNTRPRTSYLAKLRNPNPALAHLLPSQDADLSSESGS